MTNVFRSSLSWATGNCKAIPTKRITKKKKKLNFTPVRNKVASEFLPDQPCKPVSHMKAGFSKSKYGIKIAAVWDVMLGCFARNAVLFQIILLPVYFGAVIQCLQCSSEDHNISGECITADIIIWHSAFLARHCVLQIYIMFGTKGLIHSLSFKYNIFLYVVW
jgi:hypothetical protein